MRYAALDIGTNSVLLAVAEGGAGTPLKLIEDRCAITRLGEGVARTARLQPAAMDRTLAALEELARQIRALGVSRRAAVGTAALREAENGPSFTRQAETVLGCPVEVISGQREAELTLAGVRTAFPRLPAAAHVCDVGGGSTELISGGRSPTSIALGAVRLTERCFTEDPPAPDQITRAMGVVREALRGVGNSPGPLVGVGGTATTLAAIDLALEQYDTERVNGHWLTVEQIRQQIKRFAALPLARRQGITGLQPARADVILAGALIIEGLIEHLGASRLQISDRGVRWGLLDQLARP